MSPAVTRSTDWIGVGLVNLILIPIGPTLLTDGILSRVHIPVVALNFKNVDCTDPSYVAEDGEFIL